MIQKLTLEQFRELKNSMLRLIELAEQEYSSDSQDKNEGERILREYNSLQDRLLSSDLSDIPFEEWQGLYIFADGELDFSKTHANIDFSLLAGIGYDSINLQGCNIRELQALDYDETTFDAKYMKAHPEYFPDESIPAEVRQLFYDKKLAFSNLIEYPSLRKCVNEHSFSNAYSSPSCKLVKAIGFENAIRLFDENPEFVNAITFEKKEEPYSYDKFNFNSKKTFDKSGTYEDAKQFVYRQILDEIRHGYSKKLPPFDVLPQEMIDSFPNVFIKEGELPEEVVEDYYNGNLSIYEIRYYSKILKNKDLEFGTHSSSEIKTINKVFGNVWNFIEQVPKEYDYIVVTYLSNNAYEEEKIAQIAKQELSDIISDSIRYDLKNNVWSISYYSLENLYAFSQYVPIEEIFEDVNLRDFVKRCGFKNIVEFNRKNNMILESTAGIYSNTFLQEMSKYANVIGEDVLITDEQQLAGIFSQIIHQMRVSDDYYAKQLLTKNKRELSILYPSDFLDYNMLDRLLKDMKGEDKEQLIEYLENAFNGDTNLLFELLNKNPFLLSALAGKSLVIDKNNWRLNDFYQKVGSEEFLDICSKYGQAVPQIIKYINEMEKFISEISADNYEKQMNEYIYDALNKYNAIDFDLRILPQSFKSEHPDLFLDENVPDELKEAFYNYTSDTPFTFEFLRQHKDWLPYLEGKNVLFSLKKRNIGIRGLEQLFEKYGKQEALRIGMKNPESVMQMLKQNKFDVLSGWYDKLHFVPHHVVMKEFPFEQADKFVASSKKWSQLMKIERYNINEDTKAALLKASMCFGVFDNDIDGFNKTMQLFSDVPKTLSSQDMQRMIDFIQKKISSLGDNPNPKMVENYNKQLALIQQCYGQSKEGIFSLKINSQQNKNAVQILRSIMEEANVSTMLTPDKAHKLFGGFQMKYEPDFRDFILKNMDTILSSDEYIAYISSMQKQWSNIKALNSNRVLTLDLAMAFVKSNNYENVQVGNQKLAEISSMAGYDQESFDTLQQIYNYGKSRTFSSIPRVHTQNGEYTYEILRLDDPLAVAIGTLTDCCQELGNAAETSMEHSMVDKNGRVFVIKDEAGNIVAQSWVWRNQNVLCFDNIEIPAKAFTRAERGGSSREHFTDTVFALYQQAGEELIAKDEEEFKKLLDEGKITEEQYETLKLGKVTVGTGYNDIADSLRRNSQPDKSKVARPLDFVPPVNLNHDLYTSDSTTQYVIAGEQDVPISTYETPTIYSDEFVIHDNENTKQQDVLMLQKLELATRGDSYSGRTQSDETEKIVSDIAYNYGLNPETTRIIMNANFAIIYDTTSEEVIVGDVLYNTSFDNNGQKIDISDKVAMQIKMAIEQIVVKGKKFNTSRLSQEQLEMCNKAMNLDAEIDEERGLSHGAR